MSGALRVNAAESIEGVEIVLQASTAITLVTGEVTEPWPVATALDAAGLPVRQVSPGRWGSETPLHLPPGSYTLRLERGGSVLEDRPLPVGSDPQRIHLVFD
jgi:hypothetical protein